jgi:hypothetical protein
MKLTPLQQQFYIACFLSEAGRRKEEENEEG